MSTPASAPLLEVRDGAVHTRVDLRAFRLSAVQKTAYRLAARCTVVFGAPEGDRLDLMLTFSAPPSAAHAMEVGRLFLRELLDQELREKIGDETRALRSLLLVHAFSRTDLLQRDE